MHNNRRQAEVNGSQEGVMGVMYVLLITVLHPFLMYIGDMMHTVNLQHLDFCFSIEEGEILCSVLIG